MNLKVIFLVLAAVLQVSCFERVGEGKKTDSRVTTGPIEQEESIPQALGFDFPVGKPDGKGYYNAQPFGENNHLGDDWNGIGGGNSDLGDTIYSIASGKVAFAEDVGGGWGNIIRIVHYPQKGSQVESLYAHCNEILVVLGQIVEKGEAIGTIGNANEQYLAHLHLEIRSRPNMPLGQGYSTNTEGYLDPTRFINANR